MPDHDTVNEGSDTDKFIRDLIEPVAGQECPKGSNGVPECSKMSDLLRTRDKNTIFLWERLGFLDYLKSVITVFDNESVSADVTRWA